MLAKFSHAAFVDTYCGFSSSNLSSMHRNTRSRARSLGSARRMPITVTNARTCRITEAAANLLAFRTIDDVDHGLHP